MTVIDDVIEHLNTNWNGAVTPKPGFFNGHKRVIELGTNYINVYLQITLFEDYDSAGLYRDETYTLLLQIGSVVSQAYRDNMVAETITLINTEVISGYHYNKVLDEKITDSSEDWQTEIRIEAKKLLQLKV
ncbi:hypothetical protein LCGC14_1107210 [marine sediment metagenome]|uniref:Uncharacterized protein n=1 Tax=marine sediment metagenome TaxID=412755 RepID=A0A0F9MCG7_9ZZZZ